MGLSATWACCTDPMALHASSLGSRERQREGRGSRGVGRERPCRGAIRPSRGRDPMVHAFDRTLKTYAGKCYQLRLRLANGMTYYANFKFK